ncbi:auxin-induced in root cultures protein 12-like [Rhodamnia argentea]|uniref:Auxin-induced in root cultures protein 12-like n=1 Tax=Rhodamnia argentea TaxID=178133 RepID=A0A8B8QMN6_9MYRT|nr:auxin-induced in root cultures protein 12-like [Rhodamnia argentea]
MAADAAAATAFLFILLSLITPSLGLTCNPHPSFPNNRTYSSCTALPHLNATLHFTFDPSNSSLSLAFSAARPSSSPGGGGGGWVAWAINPTSTGMVGAQALMALKSSAGSVVAKTFNISSYHSIAESKLSFDVWHLSADEASGTMRLFASVKVPAGSRSLNQVWQVGSAVDGTRPRIHDMADANKDAKATLVLAAAGSSIGGSPAVSPVPAPASGVSRVGEASTAATAFLVLSLVFLGSSYFGLY